MCDDLLEFMDDQQISNLPRDIVMCHWGYVADSFNYSGTRGHFNGQRRREWIKLYEKLGFETLICPDAACVRNFLAANRYARQYKVFGGIQTIWELKRDLLIHKCPNIAMAGFIWEHLHIATIARIAKPSTIMLEDDYELSNHPGISRGCFCPAHLKAFAKQMGRDYSRQELQTIFAASTPLSMELQKQWGRLSRKTLTDLATQIRLAVDKVSPESRIGLCQPGCADKDGDMTESIFSYRKKEIIRQLIHWLHPSPMPAVVLDAPNVFINCNRDNNDQHLIVSLTNLCADTQPQFTLRGQQPWTGLRVHELSPQGQWQPVSASWDKHQCTLKGPFEVMRPRVFKFLTYPQ